MSKNNVMTNQQVIDMLQDNPECLNQPFRMIIWSDDVYYIHTDTEFDTIQGYLGGHPDYPIVIDDTPGLNADDWAFNM